MFFIAFALTSGLLYGLVTPPLQAPDEWNHLYRAWAIADGRDEPVRRDGSVGYMLPPELPALAKELAEPVVFNVQRHVEPAKIRAALHAPAASGERAFVATPATAYLTSTIYLPQAAGIALGRALELSPLACLYLARLANLLAGTLLVAFAIAAEPRRPWLMALVALAPMAGFLRASASPDVVTIGVAYWLTARIGSLALVQGASLSYRDAVVLLGASALFTPMKVVYAPLALAAWLIPDAAFGSRGTAWRWRLAQLVAIALPAWLASATAKSLAVPFRNDVRVNPGEQLALVLDAPLDFATIALADLIEFGPRYVAQIVGQLGWLAVSLPKWTIVGCAAAIAFVWWAETRETLPPRAWLAVAAIVTAIVGGISLSQYLIWTGVGASTVDGVQGRYLLPVVPLAAWLLPLRGPRSTLPSRLVPAVAIAAVVMTTAVSLHEIVLRYYPGGWASAL